MSIIGTLLGDTYLGDFEAKDLPYPVGGSLLGIAVIVWSVTELKKNNFFSSQFLTFISAMILFKISTDLVESTHLHELARRNITSFIY